MYQKLAFRKMWVEGHSWKVERCTVSEIKSFRRHKVKRDWENGTVFNFWLGCCFPLSISILIILGKRLCICKVSCSISFQTCQRAILFPLIVLFITAQLVHSWQHKKYPPVTGLLNSAPCFLYCLYQTLTEKHYYSIRNLIVKQNWCLQNTSVDFLMEQQTFTLWFLRETSRTDSKNNFLKMR